MGDTTSRSGNWLSIVSAKFFRTEFFFVVKIDTCSSVVGELSCDRGSLTSLTGDKGVVTALKLEGLESNEPSRLESTMTPDSSEQLAVVLFLPPLFETVEPIEEPLDDLRRPWNFDKM